MELSNKAITELKALRLIYEQRERLFDLSFIKKTLEIIESEDRFKNILSLAISEDKKLFPAEENTGEIAVNLENMKKYSCRELLVFNEYYKQDEEFKIRNFFAMYTLLHETSHVWQDCELDDNEEVNRLYHKIVKRMYLPHAKFIYNLISDRFCFERNANINAHQFLMQIYDDSELRKISEIYYMNLLTYGYEKTSPVEFTLKALLLRNNFVFNDLSNQERIVLGLPIDKDTLKKLDNICIKEAREEISCLKAQELIKHL